MFACLSCEATVRQGRWGQWPDGGLICPTRLESKGQAVSQAGWTLGSYKNWCLSGGTWLYAKTQKGCAPARLRELTRLEPSTVELWNGESRTQVDSWSLNVNPSEKLEIVLRSGERIGCTAEHRWPTDRGLVVAGDLTLGDVLISAGLPDSDGTSPPYLSDDLCWLVGLYLAEGSRSEDTIQLSLASEESSWLPRISRAASDAGATMTHTVDGRSLHARLYGRVLRAILEEYIGGKTAKDKHLRNPAWSLPNDALRVIVQGYLDGDAHQDDGRWRLGFTRNYYLERDLRTASARLAATLTLKMSVASYQGGQRKAFRGEWRWKRGTHHNQKDRGEIVAIRRSKGRQFYDISVADAPNVFALASGILTHNSKSNSMSQSDKDRSTKSHDYFFTLAKSCHYYCDADAMKFPASTNIHASIS